MNRGLTIAGVSYASYKANACDLAAIAAPDWAPG
jgi:hypothetical protein